MSDWILTDDSTGQHAFRLPKEPITFRLIDMIEGSDTEYAVYRADIEINLNSLEENDFVAQYLKPYGYDSYAEIEDIYGDAALQIVAECIFETDAYSCGEELYRGSLVSCLCFIGRYVKEHPNGG